MLVCCISNTLTDSTSSACQMNMTPRRCSTKNKNSAPTFVIVSSIVLLSSLTIVALVFGVGEKTGNRFFEDTGNFDILPAATDQRQSQALREFADEDGHGRSRPTTGDRRQKMARQPTADLRLMKKHFIATIVSETVTTNHVCVIKRFCLFLLPYPGRAGVKNKPAK